MKNTESDLQSPKTCVVVGNKELGVFVGVGLGLAFWSKMDAVYQSRVPVFPDVEDARNFMEEIKQNPDDFIYHEILANPKDEGSCSRESCVDLGYDPWYVPVNATDPDELKKVMHGRTGLALTVGGRVMMVDVGTGLVMIIQPAFGHDKEYRDDTAGSIVRFDPAMIGAIAECLKGGGTTPEIRDCVDPADGKRSRFLPGDGLTFWTANAGDSFENWVQHPGIDDIADYGRSLIAPVVSRSMN